MEENKIKICFIVSAYIVAQQFLRDHIHELSKYYDVYLVADLSDEDLSIINNEFDLAGYKSIKIERNISIYRDIKAVYELCKYFRSMQFSVVHSISPKAGFITALSGFIIRNSNRIHIFTGQVWATQRGIVRKILMFIDRIIVLLDTQIMVDGFSQLDFLVKSKIVKQDKAIVVGSGSIAGVNLDRFNPKIEVRKAVRNQLNISENAIVFVFLGRLKADKGINELLMAFNQLYEKNENAYLLLIGGDEENFVNEFDKYKNIHPGENFSFYGRTTTPEIALQAGDVFCLPTYREGFGSSVIEASCLGIPAICSDVYGVLDAIIDEETGLRCKVKDVKSLYNQMDRLMNDSQLRKKLGENGRERVLRQFSSKDITLAWINLYQNILNKKDPYVYKPASKQDL